MQKYEEAMKLYQGIDPDGELASTYDGMGRACMEEGQRAEAIEWTEKAAELFESTGDPDRAREARKQAELWRQGAVG
jgi:tetratricopeptide (TPR) repeat protein